MSNGGFEEILRAMGIDLGQAPEQAQVEEPSQEVKVLKAIAVRPGAPFGMAVHEAGHVLVGVFLGHRLQTGVRMGRTSEVRFHNRNHTEAVIEAKIKIAIAGPIAEAIAVGNSTGCGGDVRKCLELLQELDGEDENAAMRRLRGLASEVRSILDVAPLRGLAREILEGNTRTKKELDAVVGRLEWGEGADLAIDPAARANQFIAAAAPGLALCPSLRTILHRFVTRLPDEPREWLYCRADTIRFLGRDDVAYVLRMGIAPSPCFAIVLRGDIAGLPENQAFAVIAHELGHVEFRVRNERATVPGVEGEVQADAFVLRCGFGDGLRDHLEAQAEEANEALQAQFRRRIEAIDTHNGGVREPDVP